MEQELTLKEAEKKLLELLKYTHERRIKINIDSLNRKFMNADPHDPISTIEGKKELGEWLLELQDKEKEKQNHPVEILFRNYMNLGDKEPEKLLLFFSNNLIPVPPIEIGVKPISALSHKFVLTFEFGWFDVKAQWGEDKEPKHADIVGMRVAIYHQNHKKVIQEGPELKKLKGEVVELITRVRKDYNEFLEIRNKGIIDEIEYRTLGPSSDLERKRRLVGIESPGEPS